MRRVFGTPVSPSGVATTGGRPRGFIFPFPQNANGRRDNVGMRSRGGAARKVGKTIGSRCHPPCARSIVSRQVSMSLLPTISRWQRSKRICSPACWGRLAEMLVMIDQLRIDRLEGSSGDPAHRMDSAPAERCYDPVNDPGAGPVNDPLKRSEGEFSEHQRWFMDQRARKAKRSRLSTCDADGRYPRRRRSETLPI